MTISPELAHFYRCWIAAADAEGGELGIHKVSDVGLCPLVRAYGNWLGQELRHELKAALRAEYGDPDFPFHGGNCNLYFAECSEGKAHLNPMRRAFVEKQLETLQ